MDFNKIVLAVLKQIIDKFHLEILDEFPGYVKLGSMDSVIVLSHDPLEQTNSLWLGMGQDTPILIDENTVKAIFNSEININLLDYEGFAKNVSFFLLENWEDLLSDTSDKWVKLKKTLEKRSQDYTKKIILLQKMKKADYLWTKGEYKEFIQFMADLDFENWPLSYRKKLIIANKKIKKTL